MNYLHFLVTYIILHRIFGHFATTILFEIMKHIMFITYGSICLTLTSGYTYLTKGRQSETQKYIEEYRKEYICAPLDDDDFYISSDEENDFIIVNNKK